MYADRVNVVPHTQVLFKEDDVEKNRPRSRDQQQPSRQCRRTPAPTHGYLGGSRPPGGSAISNPDPPAHDVRWGQGLRGGCVRRRACPRRPCAFMLPLRTSVAGGGMGASGLRHGPGWGGDPGATQPVAGRAGVTLAECLLMVATMRSWVVWTASASPLRHP